MRATNPSGIAASGFLRAYLAGGEGLGEICLVTVTALPVKLSRIVILLAKRLVMHGPAGVYGTGRASTGAGAIGCGPWLWRRGLGEPL